MILLLACAPKPSAVDALVVPLAAPGVEIRVRAYVVRGRTWAAIERGWWLREYPGYTKYWYSYRFQQDASCRVTSLDLTTRIQIEVPSWRPPRDPDPEVVARWRYYEDTLAVHEVGHARIALESIAPLREALLASPCDEVGATFDVWLDRIQAWNDAYDACNDHGTLPSGCDAEVILQQIAPAP